ncbi:ABC transporter substrate-binding protein [Thalassorhabdomicrobium marinisediminis]|uniref:ABC transporter substrate-binding protein n=1 Tax=Thalassorhabdomicrobium marinisediminis TaxID=2170577 RepID=A0A2T7FVA9_9RHOB|nr:ABC transporter substrate-binding protein [Thalassorhabdomicrobium marinisediminis]PVA06096.1 ABC transporter substrate-binding protein [Thalassorhabdomicrobium marinisediminis]
MNLPKAVALALFLPNALWAQEATVESCGGTFVFETPPERAITLNQQATEVMLALGLEDRMVGTAYLDDAILPRWQDAYARVPVLAEKYPAREVVLMADPDFLFAGFGSAFSEDALGAEADWHDLGIGTYLVDASCDRTNPKDTPPGTAPILRDIEVIGDIFGIEERAATLIADTRARLDSASEANTGQGRRAFIYDSGDKTPYSVGCCGGPGVLVETVGLTNIAADLKGRWVNLAWERVVQENPDLIVLIDAAWSSAAEKRAYLEADPVLSELDAVRAGRFVTIPFSQTVLGMQFVDGVQALATQLEALD